jgi:hypothetical protein
MQTGEGVPQSGRRDREGRHLLLIPDQEPREAHNEMRNTSCCRQFGHITISSICIARSRSENQYSQSRQRVERFCRPVCIQDRVSRRSSQLIVCAVSWSRHHRSSLSAEAVEMEDDRNGTPAKAPHWWGPVGRPLWSKLPSTRVQAISVAKVTSGWM